MFKMYFKHIFCLKYSIQNIFRILKYDKIENEKAKLCSLRRRNKSEKAIYILFKETQLQATEPAVETAGIPENTAHKSFQNKVVITEQQ